LGYARAGSNPARVVADTMSEWLRSRPAKPVCFARVGSNPTCVDLRLWCNGNMLAFQASASGSIPGSRIILN
tara:strand:- start:1284 stop:1499 length:216 start_codon:yes stop_codon:yes gene_type:complete